MKFRNESEASGEYTFSDLFIFQQRSEISSRWSVNIEPESPLSTTIPIISANMNAVTWRRMSETLARLWWMWILPQDMSDETMENIIRSVKDRSTKYDTPLTLLESDRVKDAEALIDKRSHWAIVLIDQDWKPIGVRTKSDLTGTDKHTKLENLPHQWVKLWRDWMSYEAMFDIMGENRISNLPIENENWKLIWILTRKDIIRSEMYAPSLDTNNKLNVWVALGINDYKIRAEKLLALGVDTFVLDTAHGFQSKMVTAISELRNIVWDDKQIIAGNIITWEWVETLIKAWANGIKVWIWPWAQCTTRQQTWVWRPQFSAILECAKKAREMDAYVWWDGWIKEPRDMILALAAWATHVMIWSILAGTYESTWDMHVDEKGNRYKINYGMASSRAVSDRSKELSNLEKERRWMYKEWISKSKVYLRNWRESVWDLVDEFTTWLRSAMTYVWASNLEEFYEKVEIWVQSQSWYEEGRPHTSLNM